MIGKCAEMKGYSVIEPVVVPIILSGDLTHNRDQPIGQRSLKFRDVHIFRREPKIARKHQRRAAVDRDLQLGPRQYRSPPNPVKGVEQCIATESLAHRAGLMKTPPPASTSSG